MSAATAEPPAQASTEVTKAAEPAPHGRISFKDAMARAEAEAAPATQEQKPAVPAKEPEATKAAPVKEPPKDEPKPKSALDALLAGKTPPTLEKPPEPGADDPLKEFPADAKEKNYAGLRKKAEDGWKLANELKKQLATPDPKITGELETTRKTLAERESTLKEMEAKMAEYKDAMVAVNIELDPDHRREFIEGRKQLVAGAAAKLKAYGGDENALSEALALPEGRRRDEAIEAVTESLGDTAKAKVLRVVADIEALDERRAAILASPQASFEELQRKHAAQAQQQVEQSEIVKKATFDKIARELAANVPTLGFADESLPDGKDWNAARVANNAAAMALLGNDTTPEQIITASIKAADYDRLAALLVEKSQALAERDARLAEYEGAQPTTTGRKVKPPTQQEEMAKLTPGQRWKTAMGSAQNEEF